MRWYLVSTQDQTRYKTEIIFYVRDQVKEKGQKYFEERAKSVTWAESSKFLIL